MPKTPKQRVPLRLDAGLAAWADEYAEARGSSRTAVYEAALSTLRDLASGGVPELESAASEAKGPSSFGCVRVCWEGGAAVRLPVCWAARG
jgi:hypothetical protein